MVDKSMNALRDVSQRMENEVVEWLQKRVVFPCRKKTQDIHLRLSKYTRLTRSGSTFWEVHNSLLLELPVKVIISVIVKYVEDKMQFCCSHMSHEVSHVFGNKASCPTPTGADSFT